MGTPAERIGATVGPIDFTIDGDRAAAFAEAIDDPEPSHRSGAVAPLTFIVVPTFDLTVRTLGVATEGATLLGGVHGEEDIRVHRPLTAGMRLQATGTVYGVRVSPSGTRVAMHVTAGDGDGFAAEHYWTCFVRGQVLGESAGPDTPDHQLTDEDRARAPRRVSAPVSRDVTSRYADASGDHSPAHTDAAAAAAAGFPDIILHGMCTVGLAVSALAPTAHRVAVRFARPAHPGHPLELDAYDLPGGRVGFEASSQGVPVLTQGLLETA
ncbi:MAG TPA: MaoC/PaaZ C-terminal domain-containing protein [Acidimicrobiales bacterium]|nr:MaoC/PaaZ C-terminal domain-containing protein [Acidimicrobiales bacterium]